ncbi:hypothetical protein [Actinospica sp.]|uniref:hypothetical protein n=1 Tax=Actinospica sp. TaxID=1872142 RepID=UPI002C3720E1|nr:hypothetical protein [Actinospica sp.]HWG24717.1 hypothetical protein [Actinospica sp.]
MDQPPQIEFIDPHDDPDSVAWLDEQGEHDEEHVRSHESARLPSRTTARRILGSLLVFALVLAATGYAGAATYRHDKAVELAADTLMLHAVDVGDPVTLLDPGALGGAGAWRIDPSAPVAVDVTNESPDPITLLSGSTLYGPGLTAPAALRPSGSGVLRPGQTGRLTGVATVDCGVRAANTGADRGNAVLVQARTTGGAVGVASVGLDGGGESVRQEICVEQGHGLATSFFPQSVNSATHSFTVTVSTQSLAAQPLRYEVVEIVSTPPTLMPSVPLSTPTPVGPVTGTLQPGANMVAGFTVHVSACPTLVTTARGDVELEMLLYYRGTPAVFQMESFDLGMLVRAACGLLS